MKKEKLSKLKSGKWFGQSVSILSEWLRNPKIQKNFLSAAVFIRLNAAVFISFSAFPMRPLFKGGVCFEITFIKSLTTVTVNRLYILCTSKVAMFNIPTTWYWYFNICFCSNAQFLTPRETLDSYRKKNSLQNQYQLRLFWICASVWLVWSPWAGYVKTNFPSFLRIRAPVKSSELRT